MRTQAMLLSIALSAPVWAAQDALQVYLCEQGQVQSRTVSAQSLPGHAQLVRSGNAYWLDGRIDQHTSDAMFEGAGIWAYAAIKDLFAKVHTRTASNVLAGIALQESSRNGRPWPWTINHNGKSLYFKTKAEAVAAAQRLVDAGESVFDVGLMQVNWRFNGHRFASLSAAFEPLLNIWAADDIVQEHLQSTGDMREAIGRYHSKTPSLKSDYLLRVLNQIQRLAAHFPKTQPPTTC